MKKKKVNHTPFGLHLMIDAYNCHPDELRDQNLVYKILDTVPNLIGMKKLIKPYVIFAEDNNKRDPGGWSGFVIIQESHISLHTFIKRRFITADIYSCKEFDPKPAIEFFKKTFRTNDLEIHLEVRGKKYPSENLE